MKFRCMFLTQDGNEFPDEFAARVEAAVDKILEDPEMCEIPFCMPTSDNQGRKEVMVQWFVNPTVEPDEKSSEN